MNYLLNFLRAFIEMTAESATWLILGFVFAGLVHEFISIEKMVEHFGEKGFLPIFKSSLIGIFLPMCSCGVIPAGIGMYKTGASLGSTLAFMASTPAINPAAIFLSFSLLGPDFTLAYLLTAFFSAFFIGIIANKLGGKEIFYRRINKEKEFQLIEFKETSLTKRLISALKWGLMDLGREISFYVFFGFLFASIIVAFVPSEIVTKYFGSSPLISLFLVALFGIPIYVCAVGSIPLVASLVSKGALPGIAIVFLMAGPATNAAEFLAIFKSIGRRAAVIYITFIFIFSVAGGFLTNILIPQTKVSMESVLRATKVSRASSYLSNYYCSDYNLVAVIVLFFLMFWGIFSRIRLVKRR